ncbi:hypothetical protein IQ06DRAFT_363442, partial [Phaeosphaeriaceae sp. SRC1lsM3a]
MVLDTHTDSECVDLLGLLLTSTPDAFIVIRTGELHQPKQHEPKFVDDRFLFLLRRIFDQMSTVVKRLKVLLIVFGIALKTPLPDSKDSKVVVTSLQSPIMVPPRLRHVARRSASDRRIWKLQM